MSAFPDLGHTMLRELGRAFPAEKEDIGADARLKKGPFRLETESYRLPGLGHYCILRMTALLGLMKMETLVLAPTERDLPLLNLDRVRVPGKDTQIAELYDTQLSSWPEESQAVFRALRERDADLPEQEAKEPHWYDEILYPCSFHRAGKGISARLDKAALDFAAAYIVQLREAEPCDGAAKKEKVAAFAETLFSQGGPAVDTIVKLFGRETAERLILHHMYGVE